MSEFVYLYRNGERMPGSSPEQTQRQMQKWMEWLKELTDKGHITDPGHPLERTREARERQPEDRHGRPVR